MMTIPDSHLDPVLLSAYLDDEVTTRERDLVENHLVTCEACNLELESLSWTVNLLGQLPQVPPPRTFYITEAMLEPDISPVLPWWDLRRWLSVPRTPVSAVLAAILLFVIITQSTSLNLLPVAPQTQIVLLSETPPTMERVPKLTTVTVLGRPAQAEVQAVEADTEAAQSESQIEEGTKVKSSIPLFPDKKETPVFFPKTSPEESPDNAPYSNSQAQPLALVVVATVLILLLTMGFVWSRRKHNRLPHD
jgi:hypothetical protein